MTPYLAYLISLGATSAWMLDGATDLADAIGSNSVTTTSGTAGTASAPNIVGQSDALDFDGSTYLNKDNPTSLAISGAMSIGLWVKYDTVNSGWPMVIGGATNNADYHGWQIRSGNLACRAEVGGTNVGRRSSVAPSAGTWYHLVWTYSGTGTESELYVNGAEDTGGTEGNASVGDDTMLTFGARDSSGTATFTGDIQGAFFAPVEFTAAQVARLYTLSTAPGQGKLIGGDRLRRVRAA